MTDKYLEYFDIDENYFPQINDSSIAAGVDWTRTYPHEKFIEMLKSMERILARQEKRSLWIEGAYGTGKSQCAYALKKILEVPETELSAYWNKYDPLKKQHDTLTKLIGHKKKKIVTAYRYASGAIREPRDLFFAVQESIKNALIDQKIEYVGENTLKEGVIAWIDEPTHKTFFDLLLKKPEWASSFSLSTADEVLTALQKNGEVKNLMGNIFRLADKEGITALNFDVDRLIAWLKDIIDINNICIVFIWDEFSDYFRNNRNSLSEFQKLAELCNDKPFYFVVVSHESGQLFSAADTEWSKLKDRFVFSKITLPDNIAFNLISHAFNVKSAAKDQWIKQADDLNSRLNSSRDVVIKEAQISDPNVMKEIMPLHPIAALLLKNIASAFQSNQRSMFNFIKSSNTDDVKAFQWFIENTGPEDDHPLLTVDMLWNFFYEKGRDNLTADIQAILDTYPRQQNLEPKQQTVLKAILVMQAIDQRLGGTVDLFKVTNQNLSYAFEGISDLEGSACVNIAKSLVTQGVLYNKPIGNGVTVFAAASLAGDQTKIDKLKNELREKTTIAKLVTEGNLSTVLSLSPSLRLRFESDSGTGKIMPVTTSDFTRTINLLHEKPRGWKFSAVIAFAKDETEAMQFRKTIKAAVADKQYENIVFIDALSTPLGTDGFDQYIDFSAISMYYSGNDNHLSSNYAGKAKNVLEQDWKTRIYNGQFFVNTYASQEGNEPANGQAVMGILQSVVTSRFPLVFDFAKGLSENQLKLTQAKSSAKCGISQITSGVVVGIEKHVLPSVWKVDRYWEILPTLPISKIKVAVGEKIEESFSRDGQISIRELYDFFENEYGFAQCNLSSFLAGFLLKEYGGEPYRYTDSSGGHESMTHDKLAEMIGNYVGKNPKDTFIVKMTAEERSFYDLTATAWGVTPNSCSAAGQAAIAVATKMRGLGLPVWGLAEVDNSGVYEIVQKYIELVQKEGKEAHQIAIEIGKIAAMKVTLSDNLKALLTKENCQSGMREFLHFFEGGEILSLAKEIDAPVLEDIRKLFEVKHSSLWDKSTGEGEIRKLQTEYSVISVSNTLLNACANSRVAAFKEWRERLKFVGISCETAKAKFPVLSKFFDTLLKIYQQVEILPDQLRMFLAELQTRNAEIRDFLNDEKLIFIDVYAPYLEGLSEAEISEIKSKLPIGMFELPKSECNGKVKTAAEIFRQGQLKTRLFSFWKEKTGMKSPREWSNHYRIPILCLVSDVEFENAKKTFETLNRSNPSDTEIKAALTFLETGSFFAALGNEGKRKAAFDHAIIGEYQPLLPDTGKVQESLERLSVDPYDWYANPNIKQKIKELAEAEYNAGVSNKALDTIDKMDDKTLKQYLKRLVTENMKVGIEIITNRKE